MISTEHDRRREALLAELRRAHRAELAPVELRRRWLERGASGVMPRLLLAAVALLAVVVVVRWAPSRWLHEDEAADRASPSEIALSAEPRGVAPALAAEASGPCPLDAVPRGAVLMPGKGGAPGLTVHTFEQQTRRCGPITRRYLELLPPAPLRRSSAPVVILLHDAGESAEVMHAQKSRLDFESLAQRNGIILIYANAAPGAATSLGVADSGAWQTDVRSRHQIDDRAYLQRILFDLRLRNIIDLSNDVFLVGYGDGAAMALDAAVQREGRYTGVAAFAPSNVGFADPVQPRVGARLSRVMLVLQVPERGSGEVWRSSMPMFVRRWAAALGIEQNVVFHRHEFGDPKQPTGSLDQFDVSLPATGSSAVRIYLLDGIVETPPSALRAWDFLTGADGADPARADDVPDLPDVVLDEEVLTAPRESPLAP